MRFCAGATWLNYKCAVHSYNQRPYSIIASCRIKCHLWQELGVINATEILASEEQDCEAFSAWQNIRTLGEMLEGFRPHTKAYHFAEQYLLHDSITCKPPVIIVLPRLNSNFNCDMKIMGKNLNVSSSSKSSSCVVIYNAPSSQYRPR